MHFLLTYPLTWAKVDTTDVVCKDLCLQGVAPVLHISGINLSKEQLTVPFDKESICCPN